MPVGPLVDSVTAVKVAVLILYVVAFALQLTGAGLVIQDVRTSIRNTRQLRNDLAAANQAAEEHRRSIEKGPAHIAAFGRALGDQTEKIIWQLGPAGAKQREAVVRYANAQNEASDIRRWIGVGLLLGGLVVGFVGNVWSLYL